MKAMLFVIAVGSLALSALVTPAKADDQQCLYVYSVAEEIMHKRQHGTPLPEMLNPVQGDAGRTVLVKEAFSMYPVMSINENKEASIKKFAEWAYNECDGAN